MGDSALPLSPSVHSYLQTLHCPMPRCTKLVVLAGSALLIRCLPHTVLPAKPLLFFLAYTLTGRMCGATGRLVGWKRQFCLAVLHARSKYNTISPPPPPTKNMHYQCMFYFLGAEENFGHEHNFIGQQH